jgi:hypothetical protein
MLKPDVAQAVAVALHELATNATKYGALSGAAGEVDADWSCAADDRVILRWTEARGPPVNQPTHKGFGTTVIGAMIQAHIGGTCGSIGALKVSCAKSPFRRDGAAVDWSAFLSSALCRLWVDAVEKCFRGRVR